MSSNQEQKPDYPTWGFRDDGTPWGYNPDDPQSFKDYIKRMDEHSPIHYNADGSSWRYLYIELPPLPKFDVNIDENLVDAFL